MAELSPANFEYNTFVESANEVEIVDNDDINNDATQAQMQNDNKTNDTKEVKQEESNIQELKEQKEKEGFRVQGDLILRGVGDR